MTPSSDKNTYLLGIDVGTSSLKACLLTPSGEKAALVKTSYRCYAEAPGWAAIDAKSLWTAVINAVSMLEEEMPGALARTEAIGFSVLCPALVLLDEEGNALEDPILYSDRRSTVQAEEILQWTGKERLFEITANGSMAGGFSGSSLLWLRENRPESFRKAKWYGHLNTWLALKLTGNAAMDPTNASYTNLFDVKKGCWSEELCGLLGVETAKLPQLIPPYKSAGGLSCSALTDLGLRKGIPAAIGAGDTPCAAFACGVLKEGDVCESAGTSNVLTFFTETPSFDGRFLNRSYLSPGTFVYHGSMSFTGAAYEWAAKQFYPKENGRPDFEAAQSAAASAAPGCKGVVFLPYLQGERSPVWDPYAKGVFYGISLSTSKEDMIRAVLESCAYGVRDFLELAECLSGQSIRQLISVGGGAKNELLSQIKADVTGREIVVLEDADMAAYGAALLAGIAAGVWPGPKEAAASLPRLVWKRFTPSAAHQEACNRNFQVFRKLYPSLKDLFAGG